jgi:hypothetical protein
LWSEHLKSSSRNTGFPLYRTSSDASQTDRFVEQNQPTAEIAIDIAVRLRMPILGGPSGIE